MPTNKRILLASRPDGLPTDENWILDEQALPELQDGEYLVQNHYVSLDPAMRIWISPMKSYLPPVEINAVMRAGTVGEVVGSKNDQVPVGTFVSGWGGVQQYTLAKGKDMYPVDPKLAPLPTYIGSLGMPGMTAYFGILTEAQIKEGETVLVSGGAGAVGSMVGQIAKIKGCHVVGIAGGPEKCAYMKDDLGFDGVIDYKSENVYKGIRRECPNGVDVYFDNVGGEILDMALAQINMHARVIICGAISQYNKTDIYGPKNYLNLLNKRSTMKGMLVLDYAKDYGKAAREMGQWMYEGKIKSKEDIREGIENFNETFLRLFSGEKKGKLVLKVL
ncbi:MAG: NADP-dependent oxidoreductase [Bacteroidota bacterium]